MPPAAGYLHGALRRRRAFLYRTAARRRERELQAAAAQAAAHERGEAEGRKWRWQEDFLASLPASLRQLALFLSADLQKREIAALLDLSDAALRQRLSGLRARVRAWGDPREDAERPEAEGPPRGPLRAALVSGARRLPGFKLGFHDPDGHLLAVSVDSCSQSRAPRQHAGRPGPVPPSEEDT